PLRRNFQCLRKSAVVERPHLALKVHLAASTQGRRQVCRFPDCHRTELSNENENDRVCAELPVDRSIAEDGCVLARRQLPFGRPDLPLRQSPSESAVEARARQAAAARSLGYYAWSQLHLRSSQPRHQ